ncbi:MAG: SdrD B-like domain-containing protein, partial [Gemmatimonas sp.]
MQLSLPLLLLAACSEATAPAGKSADVQVRAYIDVDASGSFTAADAPMSNVTIALLSNDGAVRAEVAQAVTGANGIATFKVAPGSYTVRLPATVPGGAVLASSSEPRIVVSALGTYTASDIRYAYLPSTISGRIFRDDNANGTFDATDTPGAGLAVVLRSELGSAPGARVDSVVTDATGAYEFRFLPPGAYYTVLENPTSINFGTSGATRRVVVAPGTVVPTTAIFT